ncbi:MAG TPA: tetratricopeptide repeat protein [Gemmatimonadales bacterium]|nr:tetratricopeptide repeat protein [Gemmatimonadales bacterium]
MIPRAIGILALVGGLALGSGCAYYNGMYNAKRLARSAQRAEREGRSFEASNLWGQVAVKAESVVARHPRSKWADDAMLLRGKALQRMGNCGAAVPWLQRVTTTSTDAVLVEEATFLLGRCHEALGDTDGAREAFSRLTSSADPVRRREAWYQRGRALRIMGDYAAALDALGRSDHPGSRAERAAAQAGLGRLDLAAPLLDSLLAAADTTAPWDSILALTARHDRAAAAALVDRLVAVVGVTPEQKARWLLEDGRRWAAVDTARAIGRMTQARQAGPETRPGFQARLATVQLRLAHVESDAVLAWLSTELDSLSELGGGVAPVAARLAAALARVRGAADSSSLFPAQGDLRLFLAAETARDSLGAARYAGLLFRRVVEQWPTSPYAPKALLAWAQVDSARADSLLALVRAGYADSPYLALLRGEDSPAYRQLEDSLRVFASRAAAPRRAPPPIPTRRGLDEDEPARRRAEPK